MSLFGRQCSKRIQTTHKHVLGSPAGRARLDWARNITNLTITDAQRKTIYALSTPPGKGGVAIVRVSGPDALHVWKLMARSHKSDKPMREPTPWKMQRCRIVHPESEMLIDDGLAVYFKGLSPSVRSIRFSTDILVHSPIFIYNLANIGVTYPLRQSPDICSTICSLFISEPSAGRAW